MRIRVNVEAVLTASSESAQEQSTMAKKIQQSITNNHEKLTESITDGYQRIEQRICLVEDLLKVQSMQLEASQLKLIGSSYGAPYKQKPRKPLRRETQHSQSTSTEGVGVSVNQYNACQTGCPCECHIGLRSATPRMVDRVLGRIFIGYTGLPGVSHKCNIESCVKAQSPQMSLEYWFPLGFLWSQIVRLRLTYEPSMGPNLELSMLRRVSDSAQCITFALDGNIDGLKDLFRRGLASPRDVSSTRGYSVLRVRLGTASGLSRTY